MKTLPRNQADALFNQYWDEMQQEWFKLEVLQDYAAEDEGPSLKAWLEGNKQGSVELMQNDSDPEFTAACLRKRQQGVKLTRIHLVEEPFTPYLEWEIEFYKRVSVPLRGENVMLARKSEVKGFTLPSGDLMMFDMKRVVVNAYAPQGRMTHETFYDEQDDISHFLVLRQRLLQRAKPLKI